MEEKSRITLMKVFQQKLAENSAKRSIDRKLV